MRRGTILKLVLPADAHQTRNFICVLLGVMLSHGWCTSLAAQSTPSSHIDRGQPYATMNPAAEPTPLEQKVKAAYLYNFSRYFDWPTHAFVSPSSPFVIGVLGADPLGPQLDKLAEKKQVKRRPIVIHRFTGADQLQPCHLIFVTRSATIDEFQRTLQKTNGQPILVVSEHPSGMSGSAVQLFVDQSATVGFEIDVDVVNNKRLKVSAKLLKLARSQKSAGD